MREDSATDLKRGKWITTSELVSPVGARKSLGIAFAGFRRLVMQPPLMGSEGGATL